jgi:hypothetical protein
MHRIDHGRTEVHDMCGSLIGHNHQVSVPDNAGTAVVDRLAADGYGYRSGWTDRDGRHGPAGQHWMLFTRLERPDGTVSPPVAF